MTTNATTAQLNEALTLCNKKFGYKLSFKRIEPKGKKIIFTLKSPSGIRGSRNAASGKKGPYASWEAHGQFFDCLFDLFQGIVIDSSHGKITESSGNWKEIPMGAYGVTMSDFTNK